MRLLLFPYAGGNAHVYRPLLKALPSFIEPVCIEYPGRGQRIKERCLRDMQRLAESCFNQLFQQSQLQGDYAIYGHSMGAIVAYLVTQHVQGHYLPLPKRLFVSGKSAPQLHVSKQRHLLASDELWALLGSMGGTAAEISQHAELKAFLEPVLRADFEALDTWGYQEESPLPVPISAAVGREEGISISDVEGWANRTTKSFDWQHVPGNHFFIFDQSEWMGQWFGEALQTSSDMPSAPLNA